MAFWIMIEYAFLETPKVKLYNKDIEFYRIGWAQFKMFCNI